MTPSRYRGNLRRTSILTTPNKGRATISKKRRQRHNNDPPTIENFHGMRGKMSSNCLWHACQALFVGLLLFSIGAVMSILGFHADGLLDHNNNSTEEITYDLYSDRTNVRFSKLSYAGPIVMGIGGFIIVATCVMTFEARDSASKVGPASYTGARTAGGLYTNTYRARTRSLDVRSVGSQTMAESTTTSSTALHIFDKKALLETFRKFSRTIRTGSTCKDEDQFHRSPSAPNLLASEGLSCKITTSSRISSASATTTTTAMTASTSRRASVLPKPKSRAPPSLKQFRQTVSVDYKSSSPFILPGNGTGGGGTESMGSGGVTGNESVSSSVSSNCPGPCTTTMVVEKLENCATTNNVSKESSSQIRNPKSRNCKYNRNGGPQNNSSTSICLDSVTLQSDEIQCAGSTTSQICVSGNRRKSTTGQESRQIQCHSSFRRNSASPNPNVHFEPATVELHEPHTVVHNNSLVPGPSSPPSSTLEIVSDSSCPAKIVSPKPSPRPPEANCSVRIRTSEMNRASSMAVGGSRPKLRAELSCRPMLMRQSRVVESREREDQCEIISVADSDDDPIIEEDPSAAV